MNPDGLRRNLRKRDGRWYWHWDPRFLDDQHTAAAVLDRNDERARTARAAIRIPTMLVRGARSRVVGRPAMQELLDLIPSATAVEVAGAGHMVAGDEPDAFGALLVTFLDLALRS